MSAHRVFFHPFPQANCLTIKNQDKTVTFDVDPVLSWHHSTRASIFYSEDSESRLGEAWAILGQDLAESVIYVIGQCGKGFADLHSLDMQKKISHQSLVELLQQVIPDDFAGKLKVFACHSGSDSGSAISFTVQLAAFIGLMQLWPGTRVYGYTELVSPVAMEDSLRDLDKFYSGDDPHKKADQHRIAVGTGKRAREYQIITKV